MRRKQRVGEPRAGATPHPPTGGAGSPAPGSLFLVARRDSLANGDLCPAHIMTPALAQATGLGRSLGEWNSSGFPSLGFVPELNTYIANGYNLSANSLLKQHLLLSPPNSEASLVCLN